MKNIIRLFWSAVILKDINWGWDCRLMWAAANRVLQVLIREKNPNYDYARSRLEIDEFTDEFTDEHALANSQG